MKARFSGSCVASVGWFGGLLGCNTPFPHRFWSCLGPGTSDAENGVRDVSLWGALLGVEKTVIERVEFDEDADLLVAHVRPTSRARSRCGRCRRRSPGYDAGQGRRWWRALDLGTVRAVLEADAPRVTCREHGVGVARPFRGRGMARATRTPSTRRWPGWRPSRRSRR